jgi:RNase P/RNase MRP subunit POP5
MPKKSPGERWRYIAFEIEGDGPNSRSDFLDALLFTSRKSRMGDSFRITVFENNFGILKVPHRLKDEAIKVLGSMDSIRGSPCKVTTLRTSGTIKTLKTRYAARI